MKLTIEQQDLKALIGRVQNAVEKKNTIPILGHILLSADGDTLSATGTDLDIEVRSTAPASVTHGGGATVNVSMLMPIVNKLDAGSLVTIESDGITMRIKSGHADIKLASLPISDFPPIASSEYATEFTAQACEVERLFKMTAFAMSSEETRYFLKGVYMHSINGVVRAVATDGHRLACVDSTIESAVSSVIIPTKAVDNIKNLIQGSDTVTVRASETKFQIDMGHSVLTCKVIDGTYPDYSRVIPKDHTTEVVVDAQAVKKAANRVALVSNEKVRAVKVEAGDEQLSLTVQSGLDVGFDAVPAEVNGDTIKCGVNSKYLAEVLDACNGDKAMIRFKGEGDPIVVKPSEDDNAIFVVMPMRV